MKDFLIYTLGNIALVLAFPAIALLLQFFSVVGGLIAERWRNS